MSRTYRHSNRDTKIIKGAVASLLSINFYKKNPKRLKNGMKLNPCDLPTKNNKHFQTFSKTTTT